MFIIEKAINFALLFFRSAIFFERINAMLKLKYLFENYSLAKDALKNWEYDNDTVDNMLSQFRISSNAIYPFCQNGKVCFLRIAPLDEKMEKNVTGEMEFINYLLECGYPALKPERTKTGEIWLKLDTQWGQFYATAFRKVGGVPIEDTEMSEEIMFEYGKALGKLHCLSSDYKPKTKKWTHSEVLNWIAAVLSEYKAPKHVASELLAIKNELDALPANHNTYGLVHYDFEPDNVFYDKENRTCSVIDFDDGMYHWYALDIQQVFDSLEENLRGSALQTARSEFIRGYQEEHCYSQEMNASRPLMQRFINLYGYARLIRSVAEKFTDEPEWMVELRAKLDKGILEKEAAMERL